MRHHGITTVGANAREAFSLMKQFVRAARIQLMMSPPAPNCPKCQPHICEHVAAQSNSMTGGGPAEWPAYLRQLDSIDASYRT